MRDLDDIMKEKPYIITFKDLSEVLMTTPRQILNYLHLITTRKLDPIIHLVRT